MINQQNQIFYAYSQGKKQHLQHILPQQFVHKYIFPNIGSQINKITSHKRKNVVFSSLTSRMESQADSYPDQCSYLRDSTADLYLATRKLALTQDREVSQLSWQTMSVNRENNRNIFLFVLSTESYSQRKPIEQISHQLRHCL